MPREEPFSTEQDELIARHHRLSAARRLWAGKRGDAPMPRAVDLTPADIPQILRPWAMQTSVQWGTGGEEEPGGVPPCDFRYDWVGSGMIGMARRDYTGCLFSELEHTRADSRVWQDRVAVATMRRPLLAIPPYTGGNHTVSRAIALHLPLEGEDGRVGVILTVTAFES
jgi:hypothetical protein